MQDPSANERQLEQCREEIRTLELSVERAEISVIAEKKLRQDLDQVVEELQKQLERQPELLKGHLSELDFYLKKEKFEQYTSKTTGDDYTGGKVERELEEICDTASDFLLLAQGKPAPVRDD